MKTKSSLENWKNVSKKLIKKNGLNLSCLKIIIKLNKLTWDKKSKEMKKQLFLKLSTIL